MRIQAIAGAALLFAVAGALPAQVEEAQVALLTDVVFEVRDVSSGGVAARSPFLITFQHARLAPGKVLRISVSLDEAAAPDTRISFQPSGSRGGTCRAGSLLPGVSVPIFESLAGEATGSCELRWTLDSAIHQRRAGPTRINLHWKLESIAVTGSERNAPLGSIIADGNGPGVGSRSPEGGVRPDGPPTGGRRIPLIDRPERRRPPA